MKLQGVAVVFALIVLPIIMILSLYLGYNIDTIALQTSYDTKLLDATYDAVSAIEINTANEDLSSVADSLRTIIDASANTFIASIASSLGLSSSSNHQIQPYIPALLYTVYDGFYIYTPTNIPKLKKDADGMPITSTAVDDTYGKLMFNTKTGGESTVINGDTAYTQDYLLKPFMQYAATYDDGTGKSITVNYTLDNYITINGKTTESGTEILYSKSGYLINTDGITFKGPAGTSSSATGEFARNDSIFAAFGASSEEEIERVIDADRKTKDVTVTYVDDAGATQTRTETRVLSDCQTIECNINQYVEVEDNVYKQTTVKITDADAIKYYAKACIFSSWVYENFEQFTEANFVDNVYDGLEYETIPNQTEDLTMYKYLNFDSSTNKIFQKNQTITDATGNNVVISIEDKRSAFSEHKKQVMQAMILYNLNSAIATYNAKVSTEGSFKLPMLNGDEWDIILNNVSMIAYLQNLPCGMKTYSKYAVVPSTNNEFMVDDKTLAYIPSNTEEYKLDNVNNFLGLNNSQSEYHMLNCAYMHLATPGTPEAFGTNQPVAEQNYQGYREFDFIYDRMIDPTESGYLYDHKNLGCYYCMVNKNYPVYDYNDANEFTKRSTAALTAIARERQNIYKSVGMPENYGYVILPQMTGNYNLNNLGNITIPNNQRIKDIHITISSTSTTSSQAIVGTAFLDGLNYLPAKTSATSPGSVLALNLNSSTTQTLEFNDIKDCPGSVNLRIKLESGPYAGSYPEINKNSIESSMKITIKCIYR